MGKKQYVYHINDLPFTPLVEKEGIVTQFLLSKNLQISFIQNPAGATFPLHKHEAEQVMIMLSGSEEHIVGDETIHMEAGDVVVHPANVLHGGKTVTGMKAIDIFSPPRTEPGGHVERMKKYGTMPDEDGHYPENKVETDTKPWFDAIVKALSELAKEKK